MTPDDLPPRLTTSQVCRVAGCSKITLWRRRRLNPDWLPEAPIQLGRETAFRREDVIRALGLTAPQEGHNDDRPQEPVSYVFNPDAARAYKQGSRKVRQSSRATSRRDVSGAVRDSAETAPIRLVADNTAAHRR